MRRIAIGLCFAAACANPRPATPGVVPVAFTPTPQIDDAVVEDRIASFDHYRRAVELAANGDAEGALGALESAIEAWPANRAARVAYLKIHPHLDPTRMHRPLELIDSVADIEVRLRLIAAHLNFVYGRFEARAYADAAAACEQILWLAPDYTVARMLKLDADILARDPGRHDAVLAKIAGLRALGTETEFGIPRGDEVGAPEPGVFRRIFEPLLQQAAYTPARNDVPGECGMTPADVVAAAYSAPRNDVPGECGMTPEEVEGSIVDSATIYRDSTGCLWRVDVPLSGTSEEIQRKIADGIGEVWANRPGAAREHFEAAAAILNDHPDHPCAASIEDLHELIARAQDSSLCPSLLLFLAQRGSPCHPATAPISPNHRGLLRLPLLDRRGAYVARPRTRHKARDTRHQTPGTRHSRERGFR